MVAFACHYNVLIASSSDTKEERKCAFDTISEWNGGWDGAPRNVIFIPLMWERHAVSDAESKGAQDAINKQLLDRSDFVIAIFKGRIGTPTPDYPGGTIEELDKRPGRAAAFFYYGKLEYPADCDAVEIGRQKSALDAFKNSFTGLSKDYTSTDDLSTKVRNQLEKWAADLTGKQPQTLLAMYQNRWKPEYITSYVNDTSRDITLLIYNTELDGFRSKNDFKETWSCLNGCRCIGSIVFLLPTYKIDATRVPCQNFRGNKTFEAFFCLSNARGYRARKIALAAYFQPCVRSCALRIRPGIRRIFARRRPHAAMRAVLLGWELRGRNARLTMDS